MKTAVKVKLTQTKSPSKIIRIDSEMMTDTAPGLDASCQTLPSLPDASTMKNNSITAWKPD